MRHEGLDLPQSANRSLGDWPGAPTDFGDPVIEWGSHHRSLFGYLFGMAIGLVLLYSLLFSVRSDLIEGCERGNQRAREINERGPVINLLVENQRRRLLREGLPTEGLHRVRQVTYADCEAAYEKPWPFGSYAPWVLRPPSSSHFAP